MGAVGASYILTMLSELDWEGVVLPVFLEIPADGAPIIISDFRTDSYKKKMLELAIRCGKVFKDDADPTADAKIKSNFTLLETEITSFGAQLFEAAKRHYLTVFTDSSRHGYSLKPLLEWKIIEKLINPKAETDPGKTWIELSNLVQMEPELTEPWITDWLSKITKHRNDLVPVKGADAVDSLIVANVIARIKHANIDLTQGSNMEWKVQAIDWHKEYNRSPSTYTWDTLKDAIFNTIGEIKNSNKGAAAQSIGLKRPRLQPAVPQGMALAANANNGDDSAVLAAIQASLAAVEQRLQANPPSFPAQHAQARDPRCSNCGGIGHWRAVCPSPARAQNQQQQPGPQRQSQRFARGRNNPNAMRGRGRGGPATQMQRPGIPANPTGQVDTQRGFPQHANPFISQTQQMQTGAQAHTSAGSSGTHPCCSPLFAQCLCVDTHTPSSTNHLPHLQLQPG